MITHQRFWSASEIDRVILGENKWTVRINFYDPKTPMRQTELFKIGKTLRLINFGKIVQEKTPKSFVTAIPIVNSEQL